MLTIKKGWKSIMKVSSSKFLSYNESVEQTLDRSLPALSLQLVVVNRLSPRRYAA